MDYAFSSSEGRALIKKVAAEQGWSESMGGHQKVGIGAVALVILGVIALVLA